jgi:EmrB/QacA subfamily drug resistance transporter
MAAGAAGTPVAVPARAWRALAVASAGYSLMSFNTTSTNLAFDEISKTFDSSSASTLSWVASVFFIGLASLLPVSGRLADRAGRRRVFRLGLVLFATGSALSAVAPYIGVLIAARLVTAAGGAMIVPASLAVILPEFPRERHMTAVAVWASTGPLAAALAPAVSALILAVTTWRVLFAVSVPIALVALAGSFRVLSESRAERVAGRLDWLGVVMGTVTIAALVFAVGQAPSRGFSSPAVLVAAVLFVVFLPLFLHRCRVHPEPLLNLDVFLLRPVWVANVGNFLLNLAGQAMWLLWPLYCSRVWGYSKVQTGLALLPGPILSGILTSLGGRVSERRGHEVLVRWGPLVHLVALAWPLVFLTGVPNYLLAAGPAIALSGGGWALTQPPLNSGVLSRVGADFYGEVNASFNTVRNVAAALGVAIAVAIVGDPGRDDVIAAYDRAWWTILGFGAACWLVLYLLYPRRATAEGSEPSTAPITPRRSAR